MTEGLESRLMLHASALSFDHPVTGVTLHFNSVVPF
jgi:23S rRNA-/tRNA-specific pseudouridylate synthase